MSNSVDQEVGRQIRKLRRRLGLTRPEFAREIALPVDQVEQIEMGRERVRAEVLHHIAVTFGVPVKDFFPLKGDEDRELFNQVLELADVILAREATRTDGDQDR